MHHAIAALLLATQLAGPGTAPKGTDSLQNPDSLHYSGRRGQLDVEPPRMEAPDITIDGRADEPIWEQAAVLDGFTQYEPVEGLEASERTEVRVLYSADAIYFAIMAFDSQPELILARRGERDRSVFADDWIRIMLDTFDDQRQAYALYINPLGIQTDGLWIEGMVTEFPIPIDFNPDFIWESEGRVTAEGWEAEIRVPYASLRFPEKEVQSWGIQVAREVKRRGFKQSWAPLTQNVSSTLAQSGRLVGLHGLTPKRLIEVNPVATGSRTGSLITDGGFQRDGLDEEFGLNARVGITSNLILDATINPDFSQIEADVTRITVNERFALFFPEKRPFFLEGAEVFRTPRNLVHTRRIADPITGGKLSGKIGAFSVAYLGAIDEGPKTLGGGDDSAVFNLIRARRDIGEGSTLGFLYTDRTLTGGDVYNRVVSADSRILFGGRYTLTTQFAGSWTSTGPDAEDRSGFQPLVLAQFQGSGRSFGFDAKLDDVNPGFRTQSGFIPRVGDTEVASSVRYALFGAPGALIERFNTEVKFDGFWKHDEFWDGGSPFEWEVELWPTLTLRGGRTLTFIYRSGYFRFDPATYSSFAVQGATGTEAFDVGEPLTHMQAIGVIPRVRVNNSIDVNGLLFAREVPIFAEAARGFELQVSPTVQLRPSSALQLDLSHTYSKIWRRRDDSVFSTVNLSRVKTQYHFTNAVFVRLIVQYNFQDRDRLLDPIGGRPILIAGSPAEASRTSSFDGQFLLSFEPSPGTVFFLGYSRLMRGDRLSYQLSHMELTQDGLFMKLSYLFRL